MPKIFQQWFPTMDLLTTTALFVNVQDCFIQSNLNAHFDTITPSLVIDPPSENRPVGDPHPSGNPPRFSINWRWRSLFDQAFTLIYNSTSYYRRTTYSHILKRPSCYCRIIEVVSQENLAYQGSMPSSEESVQPLLKLYGLFRLQLSTFSRYHGHRLPRNGQNFDQCHWWFRQLGLSTNVILWHDRHISGHWPSSMANPSKDCTQD